MTIKTLWTIIIKTLGIYFLFQTVSAASQLLASLISVSATPNNGIPMLPFILLPLMMFSIYFVIPLILIFKSAWLIDKLKLTKGFAEGGIDANINGTAVISAAIIILGGYIFIDSIPLLGQQTFSFVQQRNTFTDNANSGGVIIQLIRASIGILLVLKHNMVSQFIIRKSQSGG